MAESVDLPRVPEIKTYPVKEVGHSLVGLFDLYYKFGQVTKERFAGIKGKEEGIERSPWARMERAQLLKKLKRGEVSLEFVNAEKRKVDEVDLQFTKQKNADIEVLDLGTQSAYYADINLPDQLKSPEDTAKPPIFFMPAFAGDLYGVESLIKEEAMHGRRVISIAYPESHLGRTTEAFARSVEESSAYESHTTYFKQAINKLLGKDTEFELWGYSTGATLSAEILSDPEFQGRVKTAVFISPMSVVDQSKAEFTKGALDEIPRAVFLKHGWKTSDVGVVLGPKSPGDKENMSRRKRIADALEKKIIKKKDVWRNVKVKNGKVVLVSGRNDEITKSNRALDYFSGLNQYAVIDFKNASHLTPLTRAKYLVGKIEELQNQTNVPHLVEI